MEIRNMVQKPYLHSHQLLLYIFLAFFVSKLLDFLIRGRLKHWAAKTKTKFDDALLELCRGPLKIVVFVILLHLGLRIVSWPEWFAEFLSRSGRHRLRFPNPDRLCETGGQIARN